MRDSTPTPITLRPLVNQPSGRGGGVAACAGTLLPPAPPLHTWRLAVQARLQGSRGAVQMRLLGRQSHAEKSHFQPDAEGSVMRWAQRTGGGRVPPRAHTPHETRHKSVSSRYAQAAGSTCLRPGWLCTHCWYKRFCRICDESEDAEDSQRGGQWQTTGCWGTRVHHRRGGGPTEASGHQGRGAGTRRGAGVQRRAPCAAAGRQPGASRPGVDIPAGCSATPAARPPAATDAALPPRGPRRNPRGCALGSQCCSNSTIRQAPPPPAAARDMCALRADVAGGAASCPAAAAQGGGAAPGAPADPWAAAGRGALGWTRRQRPRPGCDDRCAGAQQRWLA
jgi:hypothetical protein